VAASGVNGRRFEVATRDRRTLELRQLYRVPHERDAERTYETRFYLYFPRSFGISAQTWSADAFYRDAHTYMRLHAPLLRLRDFANLEHPENPAGILRRELPRLLADSPPTALALDTLAKTLGAELVDAVTLATRAIADRIRGADIADSKVALVQDVQACCADVLRAAGALRRVRAKARAYRTVAPPTLMPSLAFAEEYASAVIDERLAELARVIDATAALRDGSGAALHMRLAVARAAEVVHRRRREQGFPIPAGRGGASPEYFTYRLGVLKKEMQRALYVDTRANRADPFFRNSAAMVAAGLAATWATLAQIPLLQGGLSPTQSVFLFSSVVGAYVLKDRIKEWTRVALTQKLLRWDHNEELVGDALSCAGLGRIEGRASEQVRWLKEDEIPRPIAAVRQSHRTVRGVAEHEHVLCYHRRVLFDGGDTPVPEGFGVQELFRLSLDEVLKRLDDPVDEVAYYDPATGAFEQAQMPKVYHLNVVAELTDVDSGQRFLTRHRVVVNQQGVVHIDRVVDRTEGHPTAATATVGNATNGNATNGNATNGTRPEGAVAAADVSTIAPMLSPSTLPPGFPPALPTRARDILPGSG
jgi:hypothetical protein